MLTCDACVASSILRAQAQSCNMLSPSATIFPQLAPSSLDEAAVTAGLRQSEIDALRSHCAAARDTAHCATLLSTSGLLISGGNFENAAFPTGTCAERVALGSAVTTGRLRLGDFRAVGVATDLIAREGYDEDFCSPCGMCRQALREFCSVDVPVFMFDAEGKFVVKTLGQLLPMSFGPNKLPRKGQRQQ